ncbi:MAG TPA: sigma-70 family RNA polymerase sigma factor [Candidatus Polarisedimenticolia bacterium]|jgi:RNA polymerase sigma-70 factor (ECF subfamily)
MAEDPLLNQPPDPLADVDVASLRHQLHQSVTRVCPRWLFDSVDDIVQVAVMRVVDLCRESGGIERFPSSYLKKVAYSAAVDEIRRHYRRREVAIEDAPEMNLAPSRHADPEQHSVAREIDKGIRECLAALARPRRRAVTLYLQGYSAPETGRALAIGLRKAEHLIYRGLADLRRCLASKGLRP